MSGSKKTGGKKAQEGAQFDAEVWRKKIAPLQSVELGSGLELWHAPLAMLKEQTINARAMPPEAFMQLAENIAKENRLESLPLCALTENGVEIISGHHRTRAARKAGLNEIWFLVDVSGLSRDRIKAKQLAHNSLQGQDDQELVAQIYAQIADAEARIEAFVNPELDERDREPIRLTTRDLEVEFDTRQATIVFLPTQFEAFKSALSALKDVSKDDELFLATREEYETFLSVLDVATEGLQITSIPTLLSRMAKIITDHCSEALAVKENGGGDGGGNKT